MKRPWNAALIASMCLASAGMGCVGVEDGEASDHEVAQVQRAVTSGCHWQGASVNPGEWLECTSCVWRFCQCQPDGGWGNCSNSPPPGGACDWTHPDWTNPACSDGGRLPCDWTHPDWRNPDCQENAPPGSGAQPCTGCHATVPEGTPPPHIHTWLPSGS